MEKTEFIKIKRPPRWLLNINKILIDINLVLTPMLFGFLIIFSLISGDIISSVVQLIIGCLTFFGIILPTSYALNYTYRNDYKK